MSTMINTIKHKSKSSEMPKTIGISLLLLAILIMSVLIAVTFGSVDISVKDVYRIILNASLGIGYKDILIKSIGNRMLYDIVWYIRLPRLILALAVGMSLSVSGVIIQAIVKNPLADPYLLGVSSGASLGATVAILFGLNLFLGINSVGIVAFAGAFIASVLVMSLANISGRANSIRLLLSGMAVNAMCSAFSSFIVFLADDAEGIRDIAYWLMGSVASATWDNIIVVLPISLIVTIFFISQYRTLNLMLLGDEVSITLGKDLQHYRTLYLLVVAAAVGFAVYASGMIGFVGLIIPHVVRMFLGTDHKKVVIVSALTGAIFLVWADVACRMIIPGSELPIGVLTSLMGGPFFVYLIARKSYGFGVKE